MSKSKHFKHNLTSLILSILIVILLSSSILLTAASILINPNTAAHMWFNVDLDDAVWMKEVEYNWDHIVSINHDLVRSEWVESISEIPIDYYSTDAILMGYAEILSKDLNASSTASEQFDNTIYDIIGSEQMKQYVDDFLRQQAGYLIGDNRIPIPNKSELDGILSVAVTDIGGEHIQAWYTENKNVVIESLYAGLISTNDNFSVKMLTTNESFSEACMVFKVLNLSIVVYVLLVLAIALSAVIFFMQDKVKFSLFMMGNQIGSLLISILYTIGIGDVSFVVLGNTFAPTEIMVRDTQHFMIMVLAAYGIAAAVFGLLTIHFKWKFSDLTRKTVAFVRKKIGMCNKDHDENS